MPPHPLTNFEIEKYYQNEAKFNGVYSRCNLPKMNDGAYVINNAIYFDRVGVKHVPEEIKKFIGNKNMITNISRIQA